MKALLEHLCSIKIKSKLGSAQNTVLRLQIELTWFEEIFEEIKNIGQLKLNLLTFTDQCSIL